MIAIPVFALLAAAAPFFDGVDEASRPVMDRARTRIEAIRKGDFRISVVDPAGKPVNAPVRVRLVRHEFRFGASMYGFPRLPEAARRQAESVVDELFNTVTVVNYWHERDFESSDRMLEWALAHGKTPRFHAMLFTIPQSIADIGPDEAWWKAVDARMRAVAERYGSRIHEYDILNEVAERTHVWRHEPAYARFADPAVGARVFELARKYLPGAELVNNSQAVATRAMPDLDPILAFERGMLERGAPVDVTGQQAHFYPSGQMPFQEGHAKAGKGAFTMKALDEGFERLASPGKPVHITEFSPPSRDNKRSGPQPSLSDEEVAAWQVNYYTLAFSKPYVHEITRWFVIDELGGRGIDAGLITKTGQLKPAYYALKKLLKETWSTEWNGSADNGAIAFRGFYGDYEIEVPGFRTARFCTASGGPKNLTVKLAR